MKTTILSLYAFVQLAGAHYFFDTNIVNGVQQPAFKYVLESTRAVKYNPIKFSSNPAADIRDGSHADGPDIRCNQNAFESAGRTEVLTVDAGEEVRVKLAVGAKFQHPGPSLVYMSRAPSDDVKAYDGSGDWFKVYEDGVCDGGDFTSTAWCSYNKDWIAATVPKNTPDGEYLMRFEHIGVHRSHVNQPEHYVGCVQVKVQNGGNGSPEPLVQFPGAYKDTDPYANFSIYNGRKPFTPPGPAVWNGGDGSTTTPPTEPPTESPTEPEPSTAPLPQSSTAPLPQPTTEPPKSGATLYGQCGGIGWSGPYTCSEGTCTVGNKYYSQCLP